MQNKFDYILSEENSFKTTPVHVADGYDWNFYEHVRLSTLYKNSQFSTGKNDDKPFKNIMRPLLNLQYRAEGFDVKDIVLYINDITRYFKSFLVKKYHEKWALEHEMDTFIDELVESYVDYGGALVKNMGAKPELVPLQRLAFCDQTEILGGPICEKHFYTPDALREMKSKGWENVEDVIVLSEAYKSNQLTAATRNKTPGKYVEVYELHGTLPSWWLEGNIPVDDEEVDYVGQVQIVTFYKDQSNMKHGITLYSGKESKPIYDFISRDPIYGRALGMGGAEELFEPQVWTNYDQIRIKGMLDVAAKVIYNTTDPAYANRNKVTDLDNGEILVSAPNTTFTQVNTVPASLNLFNQAVSEWEKHAQNVAGASDALMGETPMSGTPFRLQALVTHQAQQIHSYRRGKIAVFVERIYRKWIMPYIVSQITKGDTFLAELTAEEMAQISEMVANARTGRQIVEKILNGEPISPDQVEADRLVFKQEFQKDNKKFIEILKDEFKSVPMDVRINIAGKQKDLSGVVDSLSNVFRTIIASPQVLQDPNSAKVFNQILEHSGLDPIDFSTYKPATVNQGVQVGNALPNAMQLVQPVQQ